MEPTKALEKMLESAGMSKYALSKALGKSSNYVQNTIAKGVDIGSGNLASMAHLMGFRLVLENDEGERIEIGGEGAAR